MKNELNFNDLSIIRGLAALYVVINHARGNLFVGGGKLAQLQSLDIYDKINLALLQLTSLGHEAVIIFFVLSGFSIAHSLEKNKDVFKFIKNRFIRIYPPYMFSLLFVILITQLLQHLPISYEYLAVGNILKYFLYLKSDGGFTAQYWSLVYEVIFYLLAPLFFLVNSALLLILSLIIYIFCYFTYSGAFITSDTVVISFFLDVVLYFFIGTCTYKYFSYIKFLRIQRKSIFYLMFFCFFVFILILKRYANLDSKLVSLMVGIGAVVIICNVSGRNIKSKELHFLGEISYSLYLNHFVVIVIAEILLFKFYGISREDMTSFYSWVIIVPVCIAFSTLMWYLVERKCTKYLTASRLSYKN